MKSSDWQFKATLSDFKSSYSQSEFITPLPIKIEHCASSTFRTSIFDEIVESKLPFEERLRENFALRMPLYERKQSLESDCVV